MAAQAIPPHRLYVLPGSPFCDEVEAALAFKGVVYRRVDETILNRYMAVWRRTGHTEVPVLIPPSGRAVFGAAAILDYLEVAYPEPSIQPPTPVLAGLGRILEEYFDEWVSRLVLASRWLHPEDASRAAAIAVDALLFGLHLSGSLGRVLVPWIAGVVLKVAGMDSHHSEAREANLDMVLDALDVLLGRGGYVAGSQPTRPDFALYGALNQYRSDPTGARHLTVGHPRLLAYLDRMTVRCFGNVGAMPGEGGRLRSVAELDPLGELWARTYLRALVTAVLRSPPPSSSPAQVVGPFCAVLPFRMAPGRGLMSHLQENLRILDVLSGLAGQPLSELPRTCSAVSRVLRPLRDSCRGLALLERFPDLTSQFAPP